MLVTGFPESSIETGLRPAKRIIQADDINHLVSCNVADIRGELSRLANSGVYTRITESGVVRMASYLSQLPSPKRISMAAFSESSELAQTEDQKLM